MLTTLKEPWEREGPDADVRAGDERYPALGAWLARCMTRPTWARIAAFMD
jgi:glutathione S-transferase